MNILFRCSLVLMLALALFACGEEDGDGSGNNSAANNSSENNSTQNNAANNTVNNSTQNNTANNTVNNSSTNNSTQNNAANNTVNNSSANNVVGPVAACSEIESVECFINDDCTESMRCEDIGGDDIVPCCVPGVRGAGDLGDTCDNENDCITALCLEGFCTDACSEDSECPETLPCCSFGSCFPISESTCEG